MPSASRSDLSLFLDILLKLEALVIPCVIIGGFAATMYGITRATYDIDMFVGFHGRGAGAGSAVPRNGPASSSSL